MDSVMNRSITIDYFGVTCSIDFYDSVITQSLTLSFSCKDINEKKPPLVNIKTEGFRMKFCQL